MSSHALASLTATYTDSEPEGEDDDETLADDKKSPMEEDGDSHLGNLETLSFVVPTQETILQNKMAQLVSYHDDDEELDNTIHLSKENLEVEIEDTKETNAIELPVEPSGRCSPRVQDKVTKLYERMENGLDMNDIIQGRKDFRNPSIYEKLIQFCGINELGTNYHPKVYDPLKWGKESYYEELAKVQKAEMDKREKERKERTKVEFVSGTAKKNNNTSEEDLKKRKSKWDQVGTTGGGVGSVGMIRPPPAGLVQPSLTSSATGTKGTIISAYGALSKKPKI